MCLSDLGRKAVDVYKSKEGVQPEKLGIFCIHLVISALVNLRSICRTLRALNVLNAGKPRLKPGSTDLQPALRANRVGMPNPARDPGGGTRKPIPAARA